MDFLRKFTIPFFVFITGAAILVIEVVGIRILSPYFGNSIFTVSSVLSVVLLALSLGYYVGGKLADKRPEEKLFFHLIAGGGLAVIILYFIGLVFLSTFGYTLSFVWGPLIASIVLFFGQNFLLGFLSPFAVKLQAVRVQELGVGSASGQIFFWSTLGSIAGSLLAGFVLIPNFGIDKIILGTGFLLLALGLLSGLIFKPWKKALLLVVIFLAGTLFLPTFSVSPKKLLYQKNSAYQTISVFEGIYQDKQTRFLVQDRNSSAAMFLDSDELPYDYTKYYALYQLFNKEPKETLSIGAGAYSVPKALLADLPNAIVDVAEIDPVIYDVGKAYFKLPDDPRLTNVAQDGRRFLHDSKKEYDFIFSDAYASFFSTPEQLTTIEFFKLAKEKLTDKGVFIANVVGSLDETPRSFGLSEMRTFQSVFENSYFFAVNAPDFKRAQNLIFVGYNGPEKLDFTNSSIASNKNPIIRDLASKLILPESLALANYPTLTDNYAPVDYLISKEFKYLQ